MVFIILSASLILPASTAFADTNSSLLIVFPRPYESAITNFAAFKTRLGLNVATASVESICGTNAYTPQIMRNCLREYYSAVTARQHTGCVLFVGGFDQITTPSFRIVPSGRECPDTASYNSDIYFRDLYTEFNRDGDSLYGEFDTTGLAQDFDSSSFTGAFSGITNHLIIGRIPVNTNTHSAALVKEILDRSIAFEKEVSARKNNAIMTAGRIDTSTPADSWEYVLKDIVLNIRRDYTNKNITTVVHMAPSYAARTNVDFAVEGANTTADYPAGQNIVRGLFESNNCYAFLCNVSHGGAQYDFAITRQGDGFPDNPNPALMISMSCASYRLGANALRDGFAVAYLGSTAVVTPDVLTLLSGSPMVSAEVQRLATSNIFCNGEAVGATFRKGLEYYQRGIMSPPAANTFILYKPEILRNVVGFQIQGDPTLVYAQPDGDSDGLLDAEERFLGTSPDNSDTDGDGFPDGYECEHSELNAVISNGIDFDCDICLNADELVAGTDPLSATSFPAIVDCALNSTNGACRVDWQAVTGRLYSLESTESLSAPQWSNCTPRVPGISGVQTAWVTNGATCTLFFRLKISR